MTDNPQRNPHTMDYQKLYRHMAIEHGLFLLDSQMQEIISVVLEMDDQKLFNYMYDQHDLLLLQSQNREIVDIVLEMHNEKPEICTMKTAMQQYIEWLEDVRNKLNADFGVSLDITDYILNAQSLLEKEKEQIINAYKEGCSDGGFFDEKWDEERAKEYYNETYGNPDQV